MSKMAQMVACPAPLSKRQPPNTPALRAKAKSRLLVILATLFCVTGCSTAKYMNDITQVSYTSDAGTILPELQWHERIIITKSKVSLTRNGRVADTQINTGSWEIPVDAQRVVAIFEQLVTHWLAS